LLILSDVRPADEFIDALPSMALSNAFPELIDAENIAANAGRSARVEEKMIMSARLFKPAVSAKDKVVLLPWAAEKINNKNTWEFLHEK
jgi:hypothetical protein